MALEGIYQRIHTCGCVCARASTIITLLQQLQQPSTSKPIYKHLLYTKFIYCSLSIHGQFLNAALYTYFLAYRYCTEIVFRLLLLTAMVHYHQPSINTLTQLYRYCSISYATHYKLWLFYCWLREKIILHMVHGDALFLFLVVCRKFHG